MLNFRNTNIFFIILLTLTTWYQFNYGLPNIVYLFLFIAYSSIVFYGSYVVSSNFFVKVICSSVTNDKEIAISFDDGPALSYTPQILAILKEYKIKAAFFCIGKKITGNENLVKQINEDGHLLGNHSYSHHFWFDLFSAKKMLTDLRMMDDAIQKITGFKPLLFRPPYGVTNPNLRKAIEWGNYIPIGWNVRSMDTVTIDQSKLLNKVSKGIQPGAIVLFHDTSKTTLEILPAFFRFVNDQGYKIVRLDKLLKLNAYA